MQASSLHLKSYGASERINLVTSLTVAGHLIKEKKDADNQLAEDQLHEREPVGGLRGRHETQVSQ